MSCSGNRGRSAAVFLLFTAIVVSAAAQSPTDERRTLAAQQVEALGIRVEPVGSAQTASVARYPAQVVVPVARQRLVAAPLPALVESLQVAVGDPVRAGQTLAVLRSAQATELQRDVAQANSQAELARRSLERDEQLFAEGLIAQSRLEAARALARQAQAQQLERRRALEQAGVGGGSGQIVLRAPISGVVLEQHAVVGQRVEQAAPLYRIATLDPLWVEMQVPATDAAVLALGRGVRVEASPTAGGAGAAGAAGGARAIEGRVIALGQSVDAATQTVLVRAEVRAPGESFGPGRRWWRRSRYPEPERCNCRPLQWSRTVARRSCSSRRRPAASGACRSCSCVPPTMWPPCAASRPARAWSCTAPRRSSRSSQRPRR